MDKELSGEADPPSAIQHDRDNETLARLGKRPQLKRNFGFISMVGFSSTLMATWEPLAALLQGGLLNGGPTSLVYGFLLCFIGTLATAASLGELVSMAPTSGAQYHWVYMLAPPGWSVYASWMTGWISVLAWVAATATPAFLGATLIQGLFVLNNPDGYVYERWHGTLIYFAIILLAVVVNVWLIKFLPYLETIILVLHIGLFFALLVPLVYLAPQHSARFVFTDFENLGGWSSGGIAWCVGLITCAFPFTGYDGACHMSEEIEQAEIAVPRALIASVAINGALGFGFLLALLFSMGDIEAALSSPTGYPVIQIFYSATGSTASATAMISGIVASAVAAVLALLASASRTTWAFSRDNGLPFSRTLSHVNSERAVPINAIAFTTVCTMLLGLINIISTAAFYGIVGVTTVALYFTYMMPIIMLVIRRLRGEYIAFGPWRLRKWGLPINIFSLCYSVFISIFMFFPAFIPVTPLNMNWSVVVFFGIVLLAMLCWFIYGRRTFRGPMAAVTQTITRHPKSKHGRPKRPNYNYVHRNELPIETHPLPVLIPHNPLSLVAIALSYLTQVLCPPKQTRYKGYFSSATSSIHVTDPGTVRALWEMGFFGRGSLSRSEPTWLENQKRKGVTAEENTRQRRQERKQQKWQRAKKEQDEINQKLQAELVNEKVFKTNSLDTPGIGSVLAVAASTSAPQSADDKTDGDEEKQLELRPKPGNGHIEGFDEWKNAVEANGLPTPPPTSTSTSSESSQSGQPPPRTLQRTKTVRFSPTIEARETKNQEHLTISLEEGFFLSYALGVLDVYSDASDTILPPTSLFALCRRHSYLPPHSLSVPAEPDDPFMLSYAVYHHYRSLGWVVRSGIKFGVDYLLYNRGPAFSHADLSIIIQPSYSHAYWQSTEEHCKYVAEKTARTWWWLHGINRVQAQVHKQLILCYVEVPPPSSFEQDEVKGREIDIGSQLGRYTHEIVAEENSHVMVPDRPGDLLERKVLVCSLGDLNKLIPLIDERLVDNIAPPPPERGVDVRLQRGDVGGQLPRNAAHELARVPDVAAAPREEEAGPEPRQLAIAPRHFMEAFNISATTLGISQFALSSIVQLHDFIESVAEAKEVIQDVASTLEGVQRPLATLEKLTISDPAIYAAAKGYLENIGVVEAVNSCGQACARLTDNMKQWTKHSGSDTQLSLRDRFSVGAWNREIRTFRMEVQSCYAMVNFAVTSMKLIVQLRSEQLTEAGREQKTRLQDLENKIQEHIDLTKRQQDEARRRRRELQEDEDSDRQRALSTPDAEGQTRTLESEQASSGVIFSQVRSTRPGQDISNIITSDDSTALVGLPRGDLGKINQRIKDVTTQRNSVAIVGVTVQESNHGLAPFSSQPLQSQMMNSPNAATQELSDSQIDNIVAISRSRILRDEPTQYTLQAGDEGHVDLAASFVRASSANNDGDHDGSDVPDTLLSEPHIIDSSPQTQNPLGQFPESQRFKTPATAGKKRDYLGNTKETPDLPRPGLRFGENTPAHVLGLSQAFGATQAQTSPVTDNIAQPLLDPPSPTVGIDLRPTTATSPEMRPIEEPGVRYVSIAQSQAERRGRTSSNSPDDESNDDFSDQDDQDDHLQRQGRAQGRLGRATISPRPTRLPASSPDIVLPNSPSKAPPSPRQDEPSEAETEQDDENDNDGPAPEQPGLDIDMENKENDERMIQIPETVVRLQRAIQDVPVSPSESPSFRAGGMGAARSSPAVANSQPSQHVRRVPPQLKSSGNSEIDCVPQSQADPPIELHSDGPTRSEEDSDAHQSKRQFLAPPCIDSTVPESSSSKQPEAGSCLPGHKPVSHSNTTSNFETAQSCLPPESGLGTNMSAVSSPPIVTAPPAQKRKRLGEISTGPSSEISSQGFDPVQALGLLTDTQLELSQSPLQTRSYRPKLRARRVDIFEPRTSPADHGVDPPPQTPFQGPVPMTEAAHECTQTPHTPTAQPRSRLRRLNRSTTAASRANLWDPQVSPEKPASPQQNPVPSSLNSRRSHQFYISGVIDSRKSKAGPARSRKVADDGELMVQQPSSAPSTTSSRPSTPTLRSGPPTAVAAADRTQTPTTNDMTAPDMVFACFNGKTRAFYPARCLERIDDDADIVRYRVQWDGADPDKVDAYGIRALDLQVNDQVKVDMKGFAKAPYVVRGFKDKVDITEIGTVMTDIRGFRTILVSRKQGRGLPVDISTETAREVPISAIYLDKNLWGRLKSRKCAEFRPQWPVSRSGRVTPVQGQATPHTPSSRTRKPGAHTASVSLPPVQGLFTAMVFAISYDDSVMKNNIATAIQENGGTIVRGSFTELLQSDTIAPKPEYQTTGFTALLADGFSRKEKYMQALALGLPCLSGRWILDSVEGNRMMDWQTYLLPAGESAALDGAVRSRILPNLLHCRPEEARLVDMLESRPQPLANTTAVAAVIGRGSKAEARRKPYLFLLHALGSASVLKFPDLKAAKAHIAAVAQSKTETGCDWLFVEDRDVDAARVELHGKKTKTKTRHSAGGDISSRCKVAGNELIVQSVILGVD
ncbi:hypothetical protein DV735_g4217, partial [Chaetothyriales sp. CBS 134920]